MVGNVDGNNFSCMIILSILIKPVLTGSISSCATYKNQPITYWLSCNIRAVMSVQWWQEILFLLKHASMPAGLVRNKPVVI